MSKYFPEDHDLTERRAADPEWVAEQTRKNEDASERFAQRRAALGMPLEQKKRF